MSKGQSLQDPFLNALRRERVPVSIYLVNGIKLQGTIESFDQFVVLLRNTVSQMVYKHAISTVVPSRNVRVGEVAAHAGQHAAAGSGAPVEASKNSTEPRATRGPYRLPRESRCSNVKSAENAHCCSCRNVPARPIRPRWRSSPNSRARPAPRCWAASLPGSIGPARAITSAAARPRKCVTERARLGADVVLVNQTLSPVQERNLEKLRSSAGWSTAPA